MYNIELKKGNIVDIYEQPKNENSKIECKAVLVERDLSYSCVYIMDYEQMYKPNLIKSSLSNKPDIFQIELNNIFEYIQHFFESDNIEVQVLKNKLKRITNKKIDNYNKLFIFLEKTKAYYKEYKKTHSINNLFAIKTKYIVRYCQQTFIKEWTPTLFELQKWKVKLINPEDPFYIPMMTHRYVCRILINNATDKDIVLATSSTSSLLYSKYL
jgi:hypothetical protein